MRCPKCNIDDSAPTGNRLAPHGKSKDVYKCKECGAIFEVERPKYDHLNQRGSGYEILQTQGNIVLEYFKSIRNASAKTGIPIYWIRKCLSGEIDSYKGYGWRRL